MSTLIGAVEHAHEKSVAGQRVLRNASVLSTAQIVQLASMTLWTAIIARYVGPEAYGIYAYAQSTVLILLIFVNLGLDQLLVRDVAAHVNEGALYRLHALRIKTVLGLLILGTFLAINLIEYSVTQFELVLLIVTINGFVAATGMIFVSLINAREAMHYSAIAQSANALLTLLTGALVVWLGGSFVAILWFSLAATAVSTVLSWLAARRLYADTRDQSHSISASWRATIALAVKSIPFGSLVLISVLFANSMTILLKQLGSSDATIGYFAAAMRIYSMAIVIPAMLAEALMPTLSRMYAESKPRFARMFEFAWRYMFLIVAPMTVGLWVAADGILLLIYGPRFAQATHYLEILSLLLLGSLGSVTGRAMLAMNRQRQSVVIFASTSALTVVVGAWAIAQSGAEGASWAMVLGSLLGIVIYAVVLFRTLQLSFPWLWVVKTSFAAVIMGVAMDLLIARDISLLIVLPVGAIVYGGAQLALRTLSAADWREIISLLPRGLLDKIAPRILPKVNVP
jgi:PST family polysaccharide transporter